MLVWSLSLLRSRNTRQKIWKRSREEISSSIFRSMEFISSLIICRCGDKKCAPTKSTKPFADMPLNSDAWLLLGRLCLSTSSWKVNRETWQRCEMVHCTFSLSHSSFVSERRDLGLMSLYSCDAWTIRSDSWGAVLIDTACLSVIVLELL